MDPVLGPEGEARHAAKVQARRASLRGFEYTYTEREVRPAAHSRGTVFIDTSRTIHRRNHGAVHHYRSMGYVPLVLTYYQRYGKTDMQSALSALTGDVEQKLTLCMAFSSIGRESEISFHNQPKTHAFYRQRAGDIFEQQYRQYQHITLMREMETRISGAVSSGVAAQYERLSVFSCFESEADFLHYKAALVAMGSPGNTEAVHVILNSCHKLDLYRCYEPVHAERDSEHYIVTQSKDGRACRPGLDLLFKQVVTFFEDTGEPFPLVGLPFDHDKFVGSDDPAVALAQFRYIIFDSIDADADAPGPCVLQDISTGEDDFFDHWLLGLRSPLNNEASVKIRPGNRGAFQIKSRAGRVVLVSSNDPTSASFTPAEKVGYRAPQPGVYINPRALFHPPDFWTSYIESGATGRSGAVAVEYDLSEVLVSRIFTRDGNTYARSFDFATYKKAEKDLMESTAQKEVFGSLGALEKGGLRRTANEIVFRGRCIRGFSVLTNTRKNRLIALLRATAYQSAKRILYPDVEHVLLPVRIYDPYAVAGRVFSEYTDMQCREDITAEGAASWYVAVQKKYACAVDTLQERYSHYPVQRMAALGQIDGLHARLSCIELNCRDAVGKTPLHYALQNGFLSLVDTLLARGADPAVLDKFPYRVPATGVFRYYRAWLEDTFFSATLRAGRPDIARQFLEESTIRPLPVLFTTLPQLLRSLKPRNYAVIKKLMTLDSRYYAQLTGVMPSECEEFYQALMGYAVRMHDIELWEAARLLRNKRLSNKSLVRWLKHLLDTGLTKKAVVCFEGVAQYCPRFFDLLIECISVLAYAYANSALLMFKQCLRQGANLLSAGDYSEPIFIASVSRDTVHGQAIWMHYLNAFSYCKLSDYHHGAGLLALIMYPSVYLKLTKREVLQAASTLLLRGVNPFAVGRSRGRCGVSAAISAQSWEVISLYIQHYREHGAGEGTVMVVSSLLMQCAESIPPSELADHMDLVHELVDVCNATRSIHQLTPNEYYKLIKMVLEVHDSQVGLAMLSLEGFENLLEEHIIELHVVLLTRCIIDDFTELGAMSIMKKITCVGPRVGLNKQLAVHIRAALTAKKFSVAMCLLESIHYTPEAYNVVSLIHFPVSFLYHLVTVFCCQESAECPDEVERSLLLDVSRDRLSFVPETEADLNSLLSSGNKLLALCLKNKWVNSSQMRAVLPEGISLSAYCKEQGYADALAFIVSHQPSVTETAGARLFLAQTCAPGAAEAAALAVSFPS